MKIITTTKDVKKICTKYMSAEYVTVDTEFLRETTYWPKLCLIQLADLEEAVIIDPLAPNIDLSAFFELMHHQKVLKIFHAARQDMEIILHLSGQLAAPLFDTQVAASVCGFGEAISYDQIVFAAKGIRIDKGARFTNWAHRPLSQKQFDYALSDVTHLRDVYSFLKAEVEKRDRHDWVAEETRALLNPDLYHITPSLAYKRVRSRLSKPRDLACLMLLAAWREQCARNDNVPRGRILKDDALVELSQIRPQNAQAFDTLRAVPKGFGRSHHAKPVIARIQQAEQMDKKDLPQIPKRPDRPSPKGAIGDLIRVLLKAVAEQEGVAAKILASSADIDAMVLDDDADVKPLKGWRRSLFGEKALAIKHGKIGLRADTKGVHTIDI